MAALRRHALALLVAFTALVMVAAFWPGAPDAGDDAQAGEIVLPALAHDPAAAATIELRGGARHVTLTRQDGHWTVAERDGYLADQAKVTAAVLGLARLRLREPKTRRPDRYARLSVEDPATIDATSVLVRVRTESGAELGEIIVGKHRPDRLGAGSDATYVRRPDEAQAWLAEGGVELSSLASAWLDPPVAAIPATRIQQIVSVEPDGERLVLSRTAIADEFLLADAAPDAKYARAFRRTDLAGVLDGLTLTDVQAAASFGAPHGDIVTTEWTTFDGLTITGRLMERDGVHWLQLAAHGATGPAQDEARRLDAAWSHWVYALDKTKVDVITIKRGDILQPPKGL